MSKPTRIENPVLPGFHPDPSVVRVGDDYYVATSTFEWFPGVRLHHTRDLVHYRSLPAPLTQPSQLDLIGAPRSGGVWAPCLSHFQGLFYLVYTNVRAWGRRFADTHNYLVVAEQVDGPWSLPIYLNSSGFDPSLFHDEDGRKWLVNMVWDYRPGRHQFPGIVLQEYSPTERRLIGEPRMIFRGSHLGVTEGPHLYRRNGYYYLMVAEGGTSLDHAVTVARSRNIFGPYELDPETPLLTARGTTSPLQKAGHGSLVETQNGQVYLFHLCGRPFENGRCPLGRETAVQELRWTDDGWLRLSQGGRSPEVSVRAPALPPHPFSPPEERDVFAGPTLSTEYQSLRCPPSDDWISLSSRPGYLRITGRESPHSLHHQSLIARRRTAYSMTFQTQLEFQPKSFQQMAGLIAIYDDENYFYAHMTADDDGHPVVCLLGCRLGDLRELANVRLPAATRNLELRADFAGLELRFYYSLDGSTWQALGGVLDSTELSDEHTSLGLGFTGTFVGMSVQDLSGTRAFADFAYFEARVCA